MKQSASKKKMDDQTCILMTMNYSKIQRIIKAVWSGVGVLVLIAVAAIVFILQKEDFYGRARTALIIYLGGDIVINIGSLMINKRPKG